MQSLPPELELPEGDRFTLPTVSAVRELIPSGGQLPAHMVSRDRREGKFVSSHQRLS
jgi:hypothetical protein